MAAVGGWVPEREAALSDHGKLKVEEGTRDGRVTEPRMNRLDSFKLRIRKAGAEQVHRKGPMVVKQSVAPQSAPPTSPAHNGHGSEAPTKFTTPRTQCRTPPPAGLVDRKKSPNLSTRSRSPSPSSTPQRKRSPSVTRSRPSSPGSMKRPPSPGALDPAMVEVVKRRVKRVQQARLYLLQQPGPNSFLVGGDSPEHKHRVIIGPQTCSCGRGPHCVHLLFVMLRVFQVPENDPRIFAKELKNFEVETLFQIYQERRNSRVNSLTHDDLRRESMDSNSSSKLSPVSMPEGSSPSNGASASAAESKPDEEELCPICLLEMVDGESLVACVTGCRNKLHHHCMAVWAVECYQQDERVLCPLCRTPWPEEPLSMKIGPIPSIQPWNRKEGSYHVPDYYNCMSIVQDSVHSQQIQPTRIPSPVPWVHGTSAAPRSAKKSYQSSSKVHTSLEMKRNNPPTSPVGCLSPSLMGLGNNCGSYIQDVALPHLGTIPPNQKSIASEWIKVFGPEVVSCLYSRDWIVREMAVKRLTNDVINVHQSDNIDQQRRVVWCCTKILTMVAADPVFKVYLGCLRCFKVLLNYTNCHSRDHLEDLQELIRPIIRAVLLKCADGNRRTSQLSTEVLLELAKGQFGELALGRHAKDYVPEGLQGLELVLSCVLENFTVECVTWQWLLGRLIVLDHLMEDFADEFCLQYVPLYSKDSGYKLRNYDRLMTVIEFAFKSLKSSHSTVSKLSRRVFVFASRMTSTEPGVFSQVLDMLSELDSSLQVRMRKRLLSAVEWKSPFSSQRKVKGNVQVATLNQPGITEKWYSKVESPVNRPPFERSVSHSSYEHKKQVSEHTPYPSTVLKSLLSPTALKSRHIESSTKNQAAKLSSPPARPKDLPLDLSKAKSKKPVKFQQLPGVNSVPPSKRKTPSSKLYNLFSRNKKVDELLPTKPEINGTYRDMCSGGMAVSAAMVDSKCENHFPLNGSSMYSHRVQHPTTTSTFRSRITTPTTPTAPHSTPVREVSPQYSLHHNDADSPEELIVPINFLELGNDSEYTLPSIPGFFSVSHSSDSIMNPQEKHMEGGNKSQSYLEEVDWKRGPLLGTGAFSSCFQARDILTGTLMAVKQVAICQTSEEDQEKLEANIREEIVMMSKLKHDNVVRILGATKEGGYFNMFVEWMPGGSVATMLDRYGPFNEDVIINYTYQILDGLSYLHDNQILHRDLKGANLLVDSTGYHLRIGDFGAAARLATQSTVTGEFRGQALGTIAFMAPEVLRGENYGRSCDIWSVGCCIIEMATTKPPWKDNEVSNHLALIYKIACSQEPPSIPENLSPSAQDLILQCLQVNAEFRPTAKELLLHHCFQGV